MVSASLFQIEEVDESKKQAKSLSSQRFLAICVGWSLMAG